MIEHIFFIFFLIFFLLSTIGYGYFFSRIVNNNLAIYNLGYQGFIGFFFLSLISIITSFFFSHNFLHNIILHLIGFFGFLFSIYYFKKYFELKYLFTLTVACIVAAYVYKNHDDFPYYHLTYALNLSENAFAVGLGNFSHGFRTFSSLFYFHSILYLPFIKFYLFHIGPFFILIFFNYLILSKIFDKFKNNSIDFILFFSLLSFIFINVAFYRIGEHGTDRSAQILLILIFLFFFEILLSKKSYKDSSPEIFFFLILIFLASSMKAIYYLYFLLVPILFFKKKIFDKFLVKKNFFIIFFVTLSLSLNLMINYFNTGCFLYPSTKTCVIETKWSIPKDEVKIMATHYEWWAKAGGGPGYGSEEPKHEYIKNFNWLSDWIERHFFNKVSDTLYGIIFISILVYFSFRFFSIGIKKKQKRQNLGMYLIPIIFLIEWFLNHPSMRYGGYVLFAIPIFILTSVNLEKFLFTKKRLKLLLISFICITAIIFNLRNIVRINKEAHIYNFDLIKSPFFFVDTVESYKVVETKDYSIYSTKDNKTCWASKTPCSYNKELGVTKFLWMNMVYRNDK